MILVVAILIGVSGAQAAPAPTTTATMPASMTPPAVPDRKQTGKPLEYQRPPNNPRQRPVNNRAVQSGMLPAIKPVLDVQMRDTHVILAGDGFYYMTGSTGQDIWSYNDGIELWRSPDLKSWEHLGLVWSFERDGTWQKNWRAHRNQPIRSIWAPEVHHLNGTFYLTYSLPPGDRGILKSTSGKPEGPYVNALADDGKLDGEIDTSIYRDDDGKVYLLWGGGWIARMKDDLSGLAEEPRKPALLDPDLDPNHHARNCLTRRELKDIGFEGAFLFKRDGTYYLTASDTYEGRYSSVVATSKSIYGPYEKRYEAVPCGGHNNYFQDKDGKWWSTFFGNDDQSPWRERPSLLRIDFDPQGKIVIAKEQPFADMSAATRATSPP